MNRRDFLKKTCIVGLGLSIPGTVDSLVGSLFASEYADIGVARATIPEETTHAAVTKAAIDAIGGMRRFISKGDIVVVKPNIGWDGTPELASNTNPEVVAGVVNLCFDAGAKKVKIFDNPCVDPRRSYQQSGIADAASAAGAEVSFMDDRKFKDVAIGGRFLKEWPLYTDVLEADKVINIPIAKVHNSAILTLGMKNWMGIMGGWRGRVHQNLDQGIADISEFMKPALIVLDGIRILTAHGPQGGDPQYVKTMNTVIAGTDQVAVDAYGAETLFYIKGSKLRYVRIGHETGLGTMDLSRVVIKKVFV